MNEKDLKKILEDPNIYNHEGLEFNFKTNINFDITQFTVENNFKDCVFRGGNFGLWDKKDKLEDSNISLRFDNCHFENVDFEIKKCRINELSFIDISSTSNSYKIFDSDLEYLTFDSCAKFQKMIWIIKSRCKFFQVQNFKNLEKLKISHSSNFASKVDINFSNFGNVEINKATFKDEFNFLENCISQNFEIQNCSFSKVDFTSTKFDYSALIEKTDFNGTCIFEGLGQENKTDLKIKSCKFEKYTYFNNTRLYNLSLDAVKFNEITSFQETYFTSISIDRTVFEKLAFFDDIEIKKIDKCGRRTIRNIKQQLQSADNRIDYDRFRRYELEAYKLDLEFKIEKYKNEKESLNIRQVDKKLLNRDLRILQLNEFVSLHGSDWKRAFIFTILIGFFFYLLFYISYNYSYSFNLTYSNFNKFLNGLLQFYIPTNFYNPLKEKTYIDFWLSWFPFLFGKILIAFGIYETIQSFRKFKK